MRISELADLAGLTRPTVAQAADQLLTEGWIRRRSALRGAGGVGRPAATYELDGRSNPVLGVDIGAHTVTAAVADAAGRQLAVVARRISRTTERQLLSAIERAVTAAAEEAGVPLRSIAAATAATPGLIDPDTGEVLLAPSVPGWTSAHPVLALADRIGCPVRLENDAHAAALAIAATRDSWHGPLLAIKWGERLGSGIVVDGRILHGAHRSAGEIGFITPQGRHSRLSDSGPDRLEQQVCGDGIRESVRAAARRRPRSGLATAVAAAEAAGPGGDLIAALFDAARDGDAAAKASVERLAGAFAQAIAPVVLAIDPAAVVIGGGIAQAGTVLTDAISRHLDPLVLRAPEVSISSLAQGAVLAGTLQLALDDLWATALSGT